MGSCHSKDSGCIKDILKEIIRAQNEVANRTNGCKTGCERSIRELLSPASNGNGFTTIPFLLYCKGCKPFFANGLRKVSSAPYLCVETPVFKAIKFVDDHCVKLELLRPVYPYPENTSCPSEKESVCDVLENVVAFQSTGICITVNIDCFCGITCLEPITPERLSL